MKNFLRILKQTELIILSFIFAFSNYIFLPISSSTIENYYEVKLKSNFKSIDVLYNWKDVETTDAFVVVFCNLKRSIILKENVENQKNDNEDIFLYPKPSIIKADKLSSKIIHHNGNETLIKCFSNSKDSDDNDSQANTVSELKAENGDLIGTYWLQFNIHNVKIPSKNYISNDAIIEVTYINNTKEVLIPISIKKQDSETVPENERTYNKKNIEELQLLEVESRYGYKLLVQPTDLTVSKAILTYGIWQNNIAKTILKIVNKGDKVLHLGGHLGTFDVLMSNLVGKNGKILVYEPVPSSYSILEKNIKRNRCDNVEILMKGGFSEETEIYLNVKEFNTGATEAHYKNNTYEDSSVIENNNNTNNSTESSSLTKVSFVKLDNEEKIIEMGVPDFIFMDIEGAECHAYNGMRNLLKNVKNTGKHPIMLWEWNTRLLNNYYIKNDLDFNEENSKQLKDNNGDYISLINEFDKFCDFFLIDLFSDIYVKVSKEYILTQTEYEHFDILIIPFDHHLSGFFNMNSVIIDPPSAITDFFRKKQLLNLVKTKNLSKEFFTLIENDYFRNRLNKEGLLVFLDNNEICGKNTSPLFCQYANRAYNYSIKKKEDL